MEAERVLLPDAARITGLPERTLQDLSKRGQIWGAAKLGRRWTYDRMRLRAWIAAKESEVTPRTTSTSGTAFITPAPRSTDLSTDDRLRRAMLAKRSAA
jgi:hypothetical protein